MAPQIYGCAAP